MKESTLKRNFREWLDKENRIGFKDKALSEVIPKSVQKGYSVTKKVNYKSLVGKQIIAQYSKCCNVIWLLTVKTDYKKCDLFIYEVYMIEPENVVVGIFGPILYKVL